MRRNFLYLLFILLLNDVSAQDTELTIQKIVDGDFQPERLDNVEWINEKWGYVKLENRGKELVSYTPASGRRTVLVDVGDLDAENSDSRLGRYTFSKDYSKILAELSSKPSDTYWLIDVSDSSGTRIEIDDYNDDLISVELSPDSKKVSFIHRANIYVYDIESKKISQLTTDGSDKIINANSSTRFASVHNTITYQWSPNSKVIAYVQFNTEGVRSFTMINNTDSLYPTLTEFQYVKPGETLP
ncbi:MAG: DPP IV N-terminal domain-containing protein, partial [Cyclobacteriaceae bacterium]